VVVAGGRVLKVGASGIETAPGVYNGTCNVFVGIEEGIVEDPLCRAVRTNPTLPVVLDMLNG
jgi:hypothetical protein